MPTDCRTPTTYRCALAWERAQKKGHRLNEIRRAEKNSIEAGPFSIFSSGDAGPWQAFMKARLIERRERFLNVLEIEQQDPAAAGAGPNGPTGDNSTA